jgi:fibronectin type 3 domain-containing protein
VPDPTVDGAGAPARDTITVFVDGATVGSTVADVSGNWSETLPTLTVGSHAVTATATDVAANTSAPSDPLLITVGSLTVPGAPTLSATAGNGSVALSWSAATDGGSPVSAYDVYRGTSPGAETLLGAVTATADTDPSVTNGTSYYYEVSAVNDVGQGPLSNEVEASPVAPGQPPTITSSPAVTAEIRHGVSFTVTATGSPAPTFSLSGSLPRGMRFNEVTGVLSGMARTGTKGTYKLAVTATNPVGATEQTLTVHVTRS